VEIFLKTVVCHDVTSSSMIEIHSRFGGVLKMETALKLGWISVRLHAVISQKTASS